ncbi:MAG: hypothetical protein ACI4XB_03495 [Ruminococcus sp.]
MAEIKDFARMCKNYSYCGCNPDCPFYTETDKLLGVSDCADYMKQQDSVLCIIPASSLSNYIPKRNDRIICGRCNDAEPPEECRTVMDVKDFRYGSPEVQHIEVMAV